MLRAIEYPVLEEARKLAILLAKTDSVMTPSRTYYIDPDLSLLSIDELHNCSLILWCKFKLDTEFSHFKSEDQFWAFLLVSTRQRDIITYIYCRDFELELSKRLKRNIDAVVSPILEKEDDTYLYFKITNKRYSNLVYETKVEKICK